MQSTHFSNFSLPSIVNWLFSRHDRRRKIWSNIHVLKFSRLAFSPFYVFLLTEEIGVIECLAASQLNEKYLFVFEWLKNLQAKLLASKFLFNQLLFFFVQPCLFVFLLSFHESVSAFPLWLFYLIFLLSSWCECVCVRALIEAIPLDLCHAYSSMLYHVAAALLTNETTRSLIRVLMKNWWNKMQIECLILNLGNKKVIEPTKKRF